jgi:hypothetical protein
MSVDMSASTVSARLRHMADATDLRASHRLDAKVDMRPSAVSRRLSTAARLASLCVRLGRHHPGGGPTFQERLRELREACSRLADLLATAEAMQLGASARDESLSALKSRAALDRSMQGESISDAIVSRLRADARALRHFELHYSHLLGRQEAPRSPRQAEAWPTGEQAIRQRLLDPHAWRAGLLPAAELGAGWGTDSSLADAPLK